MESWKRKLRMGIVDGGQGAFIGGVHRIAPTLDQQIEVVAGCFSRDPENTRITGIELYLDPNRCYHTYEEMAGAEAARIDFVSIVTPNISHFEGEKDTLFTGADHTLLDIEYEKAKAIAEPYGCEVVKHFDNMVGKVDGVISGGNYRCQRFQAAAWLLQ